jgi:hypothetical protein
MEGSFSRLIHQTGIKLNHANSSHVTAEPGHTRNSLQDDFSQSSLIGANEISEIVVDTISQRENPQNREEDFPTTTVNKVGHKTETAEFESFKQVESKEKTLEFIALDVGNSYTEAGSANLLANSGVSDKDTKGSIKPNSVRATNQSDLDSQYNSEGTTYSDQSDTQIILDQVFKWVSDKPGIAGKGSESEVQETSGIYNENTELIAQSVNANRIDLSEQHANPVGNIPSKSGDFELSIGSINLNIEEPKKEIEFPQKPQTGFDRKSSSTSSPRLNRYYIRF